MHWANWVRTCFFVSFLILLLASILYAQEEPVAEPVDAFEMILDELKIDYNDLGFEPRGYWTRYPDPADAPYKLLAFDDLMAEPHRIYDFVNVMAHACDDYLDPRYREGQSNSLLRTAFYCGIRNQTGQMRDYSASLWAELDEEEPLLRAIQQIYHRTGTVWRYNAVGSASDFPLIERDARLQIESIPIELRRVLGRTVINLLDAHQWCMTARRNIDMADAAAVWRIRRLGETQFDGLEYYPELEDCAQNYDFNSMYYAGMKALESVEQLIDSLDAMDESLDHFEDVPAVDIATPIGRFIIGDTRNTTHDYPDAFFVLDLGGNDTYQGSIGASPSLDLPVGVAVDYSGDDTYENTHEFVPSQGAGVFGVGVLVDADGDDEYSSTRLAQGAGMLGIGVLADISGDDSYSMWTSGQGGAYFGVGVAIDIDGNDDYYLWGDGQGYGGVGGVGTLVNVNGDDEYTAEPSSEVAFRPDYHSNEDSLNYSYAQGAGIGRRGDITDGHSWSGGMGTLIDLHGNDTYLSANWALGSGYWYGMGYFYDGDGDDNYRTSSWSVGSGAHYCISGFIDEGGDDRIELYGSPGYGIAHNHDYTVSIVLNRGGDDYYKLFGGNGLAYCINMSQAIFIDTEGNDQYITGMTSDNYGYTDYHRRNPPVTGTHCHLYSTEVCIFADLGGTDSYTRFELDGDSTATDERIHDNFTQFCPTPAVRDTLANQSYYGISIDQELQLPIRLEIFRDKLRPRYRD